MPGCTPCGDTHDGRDRSLAGRTALVTGSSRGIDAAIALRLAEAGSGADALRTSIAKACKAAGVPLFSPHDLRHWRISLRHLRGMPCARIGEFVGRRNLAVTANTYCHVMLDETELDYAVLLAGARV